MPPVRAALLAVAALVGQENAEHSVLVPVVEAVSATVAFLTLAFTLYVYRRSEKAGVGWFVFAGGFFLVAVVAYVISHQPSTSTSPAPVQAAAESPPSGPRPAPEGPHPAFPAQTPPAPVDRNPAKAVEMTKPSSAVPAPPTREEQFAKLINTNLSLSTSQPNVAVVITAADRGNSGSAVDALQGSLSAANFHLVFNLADLNTLVTTGFFDDMYSGNGQLTSRAAQLSRVDYILLGKESYSFRRQADLDPDLLACDLTLACRLIDRTGTTVQSINFSAPGPGFTESKALEAAAVNVAKQVKEKILSLIR